MRAFAVLSGTTHLLLLFYIIFPFLLFVCVYEVCLLLPVVVKERGCFCRCCSHTVVVIASVRCCFVPYKKNPMFFVGTFPPLLAREKVDHLIVGFRFSPSAWISSDQVFPSFIIKPDDKGEGHRYDPPHPHEGVHTQTGVHTGAV